MEQVGLMKIRSDYEADADVGDVVSSRVIVALNSDEYQQATEEARARFQRAQAAKGR